MKVKILEVRDKCTFIPLLAVDMNPVNPTAVDPSRYAQTYYLRRCGYPCDGAPNILITHLGAAGKPASNDPYFWGDRTFQTAHHWIIDHWNELTDGDVIDVQFILGETEERKLSERFKSLPQ